MAQICQLVDGLPLGVEIAASNLRALSIHDLTARIPVFIRFDRDRATWSNGTGPDGEPPQMSFTEMAERGLRAQLTYQSYVTQQLMIELDLLPDTPMRLVRATKSG